MPAGRATARFRLSAWVANAATAFPLRIAKGCNRKHGLDASGLGAC
jgi:hypothetical protein